MRILSVLVLVILALPVQAATYVIDYDQSQVEFSGTHAGNDFTGVFEEWSAAIVFDPAALDTSSITASFKAASAKTGDKMYDGTLPQADWFDAKNHPDIVFESTGFEALGDNQYRANGTLTIKETTQPLSFDFTVSDLSQAPVTAEGSFDVDRLAYQIGVKSDAKAEWVGQMIGLSVAIVASSSS